MVCDYCTLVWYATGSFSHTDFSSSLYCTCENSLPITEDIEVSQPVQTSYDLEFQTRAETSNSTEVSVSLTKNEVDGQIHPTKTKETVNEFETMLPRLHDKAELVQVLRASRSLTSRNAAVQTDWPYIGWDVSYDSLADRCSRLEDMMKLIKEKLFRSNSRNVKALKLRLAALVKSEPVEHTELESESESESELVERMMESESESGSGSESEPEPVTQVEPVPVTQVESEPVTQVESEPVVHSMEWESESESASEPVDNVESESGSESESDEYMVDSESEWESEPETFSYWGLEAEQVTHVAFAPEPVVHIIDSESECESEPEPFAYLGSESEPIAHVESEPEPVAHVESEQEPVVHIIDSESEYESEPEPVVYWRSELESKSKPEQKPIQNEEEEPKLLCVICIDERINTVLNCGHTLCRKCSRLIQTCHVCRVPISTRMHVFL